MSSEAALPAENVTRGRSMRLAVVVLALSLAATAALLARSMRPHPPLPMLGHVPAFQLADEHGAAYGDQAMLGHMTVADFIFTRCNSSCPRLTARMAELQGKLASAHSDVRLVSFSVDPENDTPPVLADYAAKSHADLGRWKFVTGPVNDVVRAVQDGFKISAVKVARGANDYDVTHGDWFVLADAAGNIRGYYPTEEAADFDKLVEDVLRLEKEKR
jgi:protein SCO1/2